MTGPTMRGQCRAVGGEWLTRRTDSVGRVDVFTTIQSHDGALIAVTHSGVAGFGTDGCPRFLWLAIPV